MRGCSFAQVWNISAFVDLAIDSLYEIQSKKLENQRDQKGNIFMSISNINNCGGQIYFLELPMEILRFHMLCFALDWDKHCTKGCAHTPSFP